jgi:hypothetical protein
MSYITFTNRSLLCAVMLPQVTGELTEFIGAALAVFATCTNRVNAVELTRVIGFHPRNLTYL